jgi:hypothetical protein
MEMKILKTYKCKNGLEILLVTDGQKFIMISPRGKKTYDNKAAALERYIRETVTFFKKEISE